MFFSRYIIISSLCFLFHFAGCCLDGAVGGGGGDGTGGCASIIFCSLRFRCSVIPCVCVILFAHIFQYVCMHVMQNCVYQDSHSYVDGWLVYTV